jgi:hypothetical protein
LIRAIGDRCLLAGDDTNFTQELLFMKENTQKRADVPIKIKIVFLISVMILTGLISIYLGQDSNWDFQKYHYSNGFSVINLNIDHDFLRSGAVSYLNPLADAIQYLMVTYLPSRLTGFLIGAIQGINFFLLALITNILIKNSTSRISRYVLVASIALSGLFSANVIGEVGTTFLDLTLANCVLLSLLIIGFSLKQNLSHNKKYVSVLLAGLCLGIGMGLKLTMITYFGGGLVSCIFLRNREERFKITFLFLLGGLLGFFLINGYWMILLWRHFQNPIFPYYNQFFKSPYSLETNLVDYRFFPKGMMQNFFYPFYFSWKKLTSEKIFCDFRLAFVYLLLIIYVFKIPFKKEIYSQDYDSSQKEFTQFLLIFFVISYILWQYQFSIQRYAMTLDILAPLMIYVLLLNTCKTSVIVNSLLFLILAVLIISMKPMYWGRQPWTQSYFNVNLPKTLNLKKQSVVLIKEGGNPAGYLRPSFPVNWHFLSINNMLFTKKFIENYLPEIDKYQFFILQRKHKPIDIDDVKRKGFNVHKPCWELKTKLDSYLLCSVTPIKNNL